MEGIVISPPIVPVIEQQPIKEIKFVTATRSKSARTTKKSSPTIKRKKCTRGHRRNRKTNRCNKKCPDGFKRSKSRHCVKRVKN